MKRKLSIAIFVICLSICSSGIGLFTPLKVLSQETQTKVFMGFVKELGDGTALFTKEVIYPLIGGDFQSIIGKEVFVIGEIIKENGVEKILVNRIQYDIKYPP